MKKGFTLVEMIGSIVILAVLAIVAFPAVLNMLNNSQGKVDSSMQEYIKGAAKEYVLDHVNCYPRVSGVNINTSECNDKPQLGDQKLTVYLLIEEGYITEKSINNDEEMKNDYVLIGVNDKNIYTYEYKIV